MPTFELPRTCVVTIQGGGALGVELIGQLQGVVGKAALGDRQMDLLGIAGTSAGAIIAVLLWVGYTPFAIRDIVKTTFSQTERDAFFGRFDRREVRNLAALLRYLKRAEAVLGEDQPLPAGWLNWPRRAWRRAGKWLARARLARSVFFGHGWAWRKKGILDADGFEAKIDQLLRASPKLEGRFDRITTRHLTFADVQGIDDLGLVPLFLMVTDVGRRQLVAVSSIDAARCGQFPIARAVRASAGFPIFFRPVRLGEHLACIDGGVISNAPSWVFARAFRDQLRQAGRKGDASAARLAAAPWHHVALRLPADDQAAPPPLTGVDFLKALWSLLSGIGRRRLEETMFTLVASKGFVVEPPPPPPGAGPRDVLDFDALADSALIDESFRRGRAAAQAAIDIQRFALPDPAAVGPILVDLVLVVSEILFPYLNEGTQVRANVFLPVSATHMRIAYAVNMEGHRDITLEVSARRSVTSLCFESCEPLLANLVAKRLEPQIGAEGAEPFAPMTETDRTWLLSVPILDTIDLHPRAPRGGDGSPLALDFDGPIFGVLNVDASVAYGSDGLDPDPRIQTGHPAVRASFDAMKIAALRVGMLMNRTWWQEDRQ